MPEDDRDVTILLMMLTLIFALVLSDRYNPRHIPWLNVLDSFISVVQLTVYYLHWMLNLMHWQTIKAQARGGSE